MLDEIQNSTQLARQEFIQRNVFVQVKSVIEQMTKEIDIIIDKGEWDFAVRLAYYRHEFAKTYGSTDWYSPFLEIRKARDTILIMIQGSRLESE